MGFLIIIGAIVLAMAVYTWGHYDGYGKYEAELIEDMEFWSEETKEEIRLKLFGDETETTTHAE